MNLTKTSWPLGYTPSADPVNGDPTGLIRMDNCYLDELGVLSLVRGIQKLTPTTLSAFPYRIYSKILSSNTEAIWASLGISSSQIIRTAKGDFSDTTVIGAGTDKAAFGDCLGQVICFAGSTRLKDSSTTVNNLGLATPVPPTIDNVSQPTLNITGTYTAVVGTLNTSDSNSIYMFMTATNVQGIALNTLASPLNTNFVGGGASLRPGTDTIQFDFTPDDPTQITTLRIEFLAGDGDIYQYDFDPTTLSQGPQQTTTVWALRGAFTRFGRGPVHNWLTITSVRFTVQSNTQQNFAVGNIIITGGIKGQITGDYTYIQVNVNNNGYYEAKSPSSQATAITTVFNGEVILTPAAGESQVNEIWFFRGGGTLDQYYRVGTTTPGVTFTDTLADDDVIEIDIPLNPFLLTILSTDPNSIDDTIYGVEGLFFDRMLYMGKGFVYFSDSLNPDAVDSRYTIKAFGDPSEVNLWLKKLTNNVCILGTTKNLYELTGTFQPLPDGTLDVSINPLGENHPPITDNVCASQGNIFYMAADGVRNTTGSNSNYFSPQLRLLFQGETRGDVPPFVISNFADYPMAIGKTRFMCSIPSTDGTQRLFVYDLVNQYWRFQYTNPVTLFATQTDRVFLGYNDFNGDGGGSIYELDKGLGFTDNTGAQIGGFPMDIRTVFDHNGQPRNRKDTFTLKLIVDTGNLPCSVMIAKDVNGEPASWLAEYTWVGDFQTNGLTTVYFPLNNFTLGFRYSIRIVDKNTATSSSGPALLSFKLYEMTIEYDPRPEQLDYMRIQPNNLGTISRKRMVNYAFVIDTLGNNITFTPYIDNSNSGILPASRTFSTPAKQTYIYYFTQEQIGTDINGILSGGIFEFYSLNEQEIISERLPVPCEFLVIPNNDYGIPNRKRHSSYKFQINTRGQGVVFTPKLDGVFLSPQTYTTTEKRVVEYFFESDTIAIEVGGTLQSLVDGNPFEFYGVITPQQVEQLPPRLEYFRIPNDNLGVASAKRIRTIPMVIDTYGGAVTFNPIVDGIDPGDTPATFRTTGKTTVLYYFDKDSFGIDYGGELISQQNQPFEFYGFGQMERVETLPVGKLFDQLGPVRFDKIGKIFAIRFRMIVTGNDPLVVLDFPVVLFGDDSPTLQANTNELYNTVLQTFPGIDYVYEIQLPKSVNTDILRVTLGPVDFPFYRYDCQAKVSTSGMESDSQWISVR
jgi:hypothetical protein